MKRFVEGEDRTQSTSFPERLDEYISEGNPVRIIEASIDELDLKVLGFEGIEPAYDRSSCLSSPDRRPRGVQCWE